MGDFADKKGLNLGRYAREAQGEPRDPPGGMGKPRGGRVMTKKMKGRTHRKPKLRKGRY